jgi:hypothetical protein
MRAKAATVKTIDAVVDAEEEDTPFRKTCRSRWAALIKSKIPAAKHVGKGL